MNNVKCMIFLASSMALVPLSGCGGGENAESRATSKPMATEKGDGYLGAVASCNVKGMKVCTDYNEFAAELAKPNCIGEWQDTTCPTEGRIGTCGPKGGATNHYYKGANIDDAKGQCELMDSPYRAL